MPSTYLYVRGGYLVQLFVVGKRDEQVNGGRRARYVLHFEDELEGGPDALDLGVQFERLVRVGRDGRRGGLERAEKLFGRFDSKSVELFLKYLMHGCQEQNQLVNSGSWTWLGDGQRPTRTLPTALSRSRVVWSTYSLVFLGTSSFLIWASGGPP